MGVFNGSEKDVGHSWHQSESDSANIQQDKNLEVGQSCEWTS